MRFKALRDIWRAQYIVSASLSFFPSLFYFLPCKSSQNKKRKTHHKRCHLAGSYFTTTRAAITTDDAVGVRQCVLGIFISIVSFSPVSIFTQYECLGDLPKTMHIGSLMRNTCWRICTRPWLCFLCVFLCFHDSSNISYLHHSVSRGTANSLTGHTLPPQMHINLDEHSKWFML